MPVYTYRCEHCGHEFDKEQSFNDAPAKACPACRKRALRKVYKPAGVVFKGSGFYVTDKRTSKSDAAKSAKKTDNGAKPSKSEGKTKKKKASSSKD